MNQKRIKIHSYDKPISKNDADCSEGFYLVLRMIVVQDFSKFNVSSWLSCPICRTRYSVSLNLNPLLGNIGDRPIASLLQMGRLNGGCSLAQATEFIY